MLKFEDDYLFKNITTLGIGGPAKKFVTVKTEEELLEALQYAKENHLNYLIVGGGSNLLVSDKGLDSLVIKNEITGIAESGSRKEIQTKDSKETNGSARGGTKPIGSRTISVKSGTPLQQLIDYTITHGLFGLQKLTGIPGTVGGAVYGNAGAYGQSISDYITEVSVLNSSNATVEKFDRPRCRFNYRDSIFKQNKYTILEITCKLENGNPETLQQEAKEILKKRLIKYPLGIKCPGSFFKNIVAETLPKGILDKIPPKKIVYGKLPAGTLLEEVGAKGQKLDGIEITSYHANLFINKDRGTAKAFYELGRLYALKVKEKFGITLEPEVQLINLPPLS